MANPHSTDGLEVDQLHSNASCKDVGVDMDLSEK